MASSNETALYVGEAGNCLSDGTELIPGVTVAQVPTAEAEASDVWAVVDAQPASDWPRNSPPETPPPPPSPPPAEVP